MKTLLLISFLIPFVCGAQETEYTSTYNKLYEDSTGKYIIYYDYNPDSVKLPHVKPANPHYPSIIQVVKYNANRQWFIGKFKGYLVKENCIEDDPKEWIKKALNKIK